MLYLTFPQTQSIRYLKRKPMALTAKRNLVHVKLWLNYAYLRPSVCVFLQSRKKEKNARNLQQRTCGDSLTDFETSSHAKLRSTVLSRRSSSWPQTCRTGCRTTQNPEGENIVEWRHVVSRGKRVGRQEDRGLGGRWGEYPIYHNSFSLAFDLAPSAVHLVSERSSAHECFLPHSPSRPETTSRPPSKMSHLRCLRAPRLGTAVREAPPHAPPRAAGPFDL